MIEEAAQRKSLIWINPQAKYKTEGSQFICPTSDLLRQHREEKSKGTSLFQSPTPGRQESVLSLDKHFLASVSATSDVCGHSNLTTQQITWLECLWLHPESKRAGAEVQGMVLPITPPHPFPTLCPASSQSAHVLWVQFAHLNTGPLN